MSTGPTSTTTRAPVPAKPVTKGWIGAIDGLRVIAAIGVVTFHMQAEGHVSLVASRTTAALVVPVFASFFVVSGFVLYRPWALAHLAHEPGQTIPPPDGGVTDFWLRRAFRVFPLYWAVLACSLLDGFDLIQPSPRCDRWAPTPGQRPPRSRGASRRRRN